MTLRLVHGAPHAAAFGNPGDGGDGGDGGEGGWMADPVEPRVLPLHPGAMAVAPASGVLLPLPGLNPRLLHSRHDQEPA